MNRRNVTVKDDTSDYIVYHPFPCYRFPPIKDDIPDSGCKIVSIDPAIKNLVIRIEKRYKGGYIETLYMTKVDLSNYGENTEKGTSVVDPRILLATTNLLKMLFPFINDSSFIIIERQMAINYRSSRIFQHILSFFLFKIEEFTQYCVVTDVSPKLKGKLLGAPKGLNYTGLKEWSVNKAIEISEWRNDKLSLNIIKQNRGKSKTKADDFADTINQAEAYFILIGGIITIPPQILYL